MSSHLFFFFILKREQDLEDRIIHAHGMNLAGQGILDFIFIAGVGMDDIPADIFGTNARSADLGRCTDFALFFF